MTSRTRLRTLATVTDLIRVHHDDRLTIAIIDLEATQPRFLQACQALQDARRTALGAASMDGPGGSSSAISDSTARLALTPDQFAHDRLNLDLALSTLVKYARHAPRHASKVCAAAHNLRRITEAHTPKAPTDRQRRQVEHANDKGLCDHHRTVSLVEMAEHTGTVSGNLKVPLSLCAACYWQVRRTGKLPTAEWMETRARTGKAERLRA